MNRMKTTGFLALIGLLCGLFTNMAMAQGVRYAEPVFDEVSISTAIPFSSAVKEGETTPTTLFLDFYEPQGDTLSARPGGFHRLSPDFDMEPQCHVADS